MPLKEKVMRLEDEIKQVKGFSSERQKAMVNILFTSGWVSDRFRDFMRPFDLTQQQYNVLRILRGSEGECLSTSCIRERMIDRMSDASRIVERLCKKGLVCRTQSPKDRRLVEVRISDEGLELLQRIDEKQAEMESDFSSLTEGELTQLNALLDKLRG